jgi:hypothetical protein
MTGAERGTPDVAGDTELDLLLLTAKTQTLTTLVGALDIQAGLADIRAGPRQAPDGPDTD